MTLVEHIGFAIDSHLNDDEKSSWVEAKQKIDADTGFLRQDAAVATALGFALINAQAGEAAIEDCAAARTFFNYASNVNLGSYLEKQHENDKGAYKGFLEQVKASVHARCGP